MPDQPMPSWEALFLEAACGLLVTDKAGTIVRVNQTFCRWLGVDRSALEGIRRFQDLLSVGGRIFHQTHWAPLLQLQGSIAEVKLDVLHADGRKLPMMMNAVSREHEGRVLHELALFIAEDRHVYERELMRARKQAEGLLAEQQDRAQFAEQMVGIVSHDLRSPLSAISLGAELLSRAPQSPEQEQVIANLGRSVKRARRLTDDLLDFTMARIGRGLSVDSKPIDLHASVANHVNELRIAYTGRTLVHVRSGEGTCQADTDRLFQVVSNLVANAMAYGDAGSPVTVTSRIEDAQCSLSVHNFGPAIAPQILPELFAPMVRGTSVGSETRSVGLGLYIVSEIARVHGGVVRVRSSVEEGTEFTATLPTVSCS